MQFVDLSPYFQVFEKLWPMMRKRPGATLGVGFLAGMVAGLVLMYIFISIKIDVLDTQLKAANTTISNQQQTIGIYETQLGINKDPAKTTYNILTNAQLKDKALRLVKNYRDMRNASEKKQLDLSSRQSRGEFSKEKLTEYVDGELQRVAAEYEADIHADSILIALELRRRIPEEERSGIVHVNINPADPRGAKVPLQEMTLGLAGYVGSEYSIKEIELLAKLLKD